MLPKDEWSKKTTETTRVATTNGVFQPCDTPSDSAMSRRSKPEVKRRAPIQSTPKHEARGASAEFSVLGVSFGMTKPITALTMNDIAMTKRMTFQLVYSDRTPLCAQDQNRVKCLESRKRTSIFPNTCPVGAPPE